MNFASECTEPVENYLEVSFDQITIRGRSIAGVETVLTIPEWNITFDAGRAPHFALSQDYLALSHWHLDHAGGLPHFLSFRCLNSLPSLHIIVPPEKLKDAEDYLNCLKKVSSSELGYQLMTAEKGIALRKDLTLFTTPSYHCVPSNGYLVKSKKHKLKKEFQGKNPEEIVVLKKKGIEITEEISGMPFSFSGDTRGDFLKTEAAKAYLFLMECTFFDDDVDEPSIQHYGHTHIRDWRKHAELIESPHVIMIHTSQRYSKKAIETACKKQLPKDLCDRLIIFR